MGIFDKLKNSAMDTVMTAATSIGNKNETFTFTSLPESLGELQALPEAASRIVAMSFCEPRS